MSERYIQAARLRLQGLSCAKIAEKLAVTPDSARTYIRHGFRQLRDLGDAQVPPKRTTRHPDHALRGRRTVMFTSVAGEDVTLTWDTHEQRIEAIRRLLAEGFTLKFVAWKIGLSVNHLRVLMSNHPALQDVRPERPILRKNGKSLRVTPETYALLQNYAEKRAMPIHRAVHYLIEQASQKS